MRLATMLFMASKGFEVDFGFWTEESFEVTEVGSEVLLGDVLGPGGFSPFGAHVSGRPYATG